MTEVEHGNFLPPAGPPPLLSHDQLFDLTRQGWLRVSLPDTLLEDITALTKQSNSLFDKPHDEKRQLYPARQGTEYGYYAVENEKEYVTFRCRVHADSALEDAARRVWHGAAKFLYRILCDLARAENLTPAMWDDLLDGCLTVPESTEQMTPTLLRTFRYYPGSGFADKHTDLGLLTLCVGTDRGLQVQDISGEEATYIDANGPVVLVASYLAVLSNGAIRPAAHRVVETARGRSSIVFALRPSLKHPIDLSNFGGEGTIHAKDLWEEIQSRTVNINAAKNIRDFQRQRQSNRQRAKGTG